MGCWANEPRLMAHRIAIDIPLPIPPSPLSSSCGHGGRILVDQTPTRSLRRLRPARLRCVCAGRSTLRQQCRSGAKTMPTQRIYPTLAAFESDLKRRQFSWSKMCCATWPCSHSNCLARSTLPLPRQSGHTPTLSSPLGGWDVITPAYRHRGQKTFRQRGFMVGQWGVVLPGHKVFHASLATAGTCPLPRARNRSTRAATP